MKIFVTGAAGFIGHKVVNILQQRGHDVYGCDSYDIFGALGSDGEERINKLRHERIFNFHHYPEKCDITDFFKLRELIYAIKPQIVIHLAAMSSAALVKRYPAEGIAGLTVGLHNAIRASSISLVETFVYVSSSTVYGKFTQTPQSVFSTYDPTTMYGQYKLAGETVVKHTTGNMPWVILRPCAVYGPMDFGGRVIEKFLSSAAAGGQLTVHGLAETVDFTYIDDCALGIVQAALSESSWFGTYNIARGKARTLLEAATIAKNLTGGGYINIVTSNAEISGRGTLDISDATKDFDFRPVVDLEEGMKETWEWMKQRRSAIV